jgi:hypothetical protein
MRARFLVEGSFILPSRSYVVFAGNVIDGVIRKGMKLIVPFNRHTSMHLLIDGVEFIDPVGQVGLCVRYKDQQELEFIQSFNISQEEVQIIQ